MPLSILRGLILLYRHFLSNPAVLDIYFSSLRSNHIFRSGHNNFRSDNLDDMTLIISEMMPTVSFEFHTILTLHWLPSSYSFFSDHAQPYKKYNPCHKQYRGKQHDYSCCYCRYPFAYSCFIASIYSSAHILFVIFCLRIVYAIYALSIASIHLLSSLYGFLLRLFVIPHSFHPPRSIFFNSSMPISLQSGSMMLTAPRLTFVPSILILG